MKICGWYCATCFICGFTEGREFYESVSLEDMVSLLGWAYIGNRPVCFKHQITITANYVEDREMYPCGNQVLVKTDKLVPLYDFEWKRGGS